MPPLEPSSLSHLDMKFRDWTSLSYHLLWAYQGPVVAPGRDRTTIDPDTSCWLIKKGHVVLTTNGQQTRAEAGQWVFVAAPERHQKFSDDIEILSLHFHLTWPGQRPVIEQKENQVFAAADHPELERAARPLVKQLHQNFPDAAVFLPAQPCRMDQYLRMQNLLPLWLIAYLKVQATLGGLTQNLKIEDDRVLRAVNELDRQSLQDPFSSKTLSARIGLGLSQLNALFSKTMGVSPGKYFERRRFEESKSLLRHTNVSIKEIAFTLGFGYESHFSMWFRRLQKQSPTAFREETKR